MLSCGCTVLRKGRGSLVTEASSKSYLWIAIASYDARFFRICQNYITCIESGTFRCDVYQSGQALLDALKKGLPYRAILLDNALTDMESSDFCSRLRDLDPQYRPWLLLVPTCSVDEFCSMFRADRESSPEVFQVRQMELSGLNSLLYDLESMLQAHVTQMDSDAVLVQLLLRWGGSLNSIGAQYLRECMELALHCEPHFAVRKDVMLPVGEHHSISVTAVDSGIRRLIKGMDDRNKPEWQAFKDRHPVQDNHLTTGKFLYFVRDELLLPQHEEVLSPLEGEPQVNEREAQPV